MWKASSTMIRYGAVRRILSRFRVSPTLSSRSSVTDPRLDGPNGGYVVYDSRVNLTEPVQISRCPQKRRKIRLDEYLIQRYPQHPERSLKGWIARGKVSVEGRVIDKAGTQIREGQRVMLDVQETRFVSRAGYKLDAALQHFGIEVRDKYCLDAGIGTGGFTDCLLQYGAAKVYGVDVGYGDVDYALRINPRVQLLERTNLRLLDADLIEHPIDLVTLDLSFISVLKVIPIVAELMDARGEMVILIKPQFEARREDVKPGGIVDDPEVHRDILQDIKHGIEEEGFDFIGIIESPLRGKDSENVEYLAYFQYP